MSTNLYSIPLDTYIAVQNRIIEVLRDEYPSGLIPVVGVDGEPYVARIPYMTDQAVSKGIIDWDVDQAAANAGLAYLDVKIAGKQMVLGFNSTDLRRSGVAVLNAKTKSIINRFAYEVDDAIWKGNTEGVVTLSTGLIAQATDANGIITEAQTTAQIVFANACALYQAIPAKYRSKSPCVLLMDWKSYDRMGTGIATGFTESALNVFKKTYPNCTIVPTDSILASGDTVGTNGRQLCFVQDQDVVRIVRAKDIGPVGPALTQLDGGVKQLWGSLFAVKVIDALGVQYTGTTCTF